MGKRADRLCICEGAWVALFGSPAGRSGWAGVRGGNDDDKRLAGGVERKKEGGLLVAALLVAVSSRSPVC